MRRDDHFLMFIVGIAFRIAITLPLTGIASSLGLSRDIAFFVALSLVFLPHLMIAAFDRLQDFTSPHHHFDTHLPDEKRTARLDRDWLIRLYFWYIFLLTILIVLVGIIFGPKYFKIPPPP